MEDVTPTWIYVVIPTTYTRSMWKSFWHFMADNGIFRDLFKRTQKNRTTFEAISMPICNTNNSFHKFITVKTINEKKLTTRRRYERTLNWWSRRHTWNENFRFRLHTVGCHLRKQHCRIFMWNITRFWLTSIVQFSTSFLRICRISFLFRRRNALKVLSKSDQVSIYR